MDVTQEIEQRAQWSALAWAACCALCSISCVQSFLSTGYIVQGNNLCFVTHVTFFLVVQPTRHHLLHDPPAQDPLLHGEPHHPLRRHLLPHRPRLLPAIGLGRKGNQEQHCVLLIGSVISINAFIFQSM